MRMVSRTSRLGSSALRGTLQASLHTSQRNCSSRVPNNRWLMSAQRRLATEAVAKEEVGVPYSKLTLGVPKENIAGETRVALTPASVQVLLYLDLIFSLL